MGRGGTPVGAYRLHRELKPLCKECKREEIDGGDLCHGCRQRLAYQKKAAAEKLKACHEIAGRLYKKGAKQQGRPVGAYCNTPLLENKYKDVFSWINTQVKKRKSLVLILHCLERLEEAGRGVLQYAPTPDPLIPPAVPRGEVWAYLEGTLRRLEEKSEAEKLRQRGPMKLGDIPLNLKDLANMGEKK